MRLHLLLACLLACPSPATAKSEKKDNHIFADLDAQHLLIAVVGALALGKIFPYFNSKHIHHIDSASGDTFSSEESEEIGGSMVVNPHETAELPDVNFNDLDHEIAMDLAKEFYNTDVVYSLGSGASGHVFTNKKREHALKIMKPTTNAAVENVNQEISIHKSLRHDNILVLVSSEIKRDTYYLTLEIAEKSLDDEIREGHLQERNPETLRRKTALIHQLIQGMIYLKKKNIRHLDIKPENLLLANGNLKIADFGVSIKFNKLKELFKNLRLNQARGSLKYMSPELLRMLKKLFDNHKNVVFDLAKADEWSTGITIAEILLGGFFFGDESEESEKIRALAEENPDLFAGHMITETQGALNIIEKTEGLKEFQDLVNCLLQENPKYRLSFKVKKFKNLVNQLPKPRPQNK